MLKLFAILDWSMWVFYWWSRIKTTQTWVVDEFRCMCSKRSISGDWTTLNMAGERSYRLFWGGTRLAMRVHLGRLPIYLWLNGLSSVNDLSMVIILTDMWRLHQFMHDVTYHPPLTSENTTTYVNYCNNGLWGFKKRMNELITAFLFFVVNVETKVVQSFGTLISDHVY